MTIKITYSSFEGIKKEIEIKDANDLQKQYSLEKFFGDTSDDVKPVGEAMGINIADGGIVTSDQIVMLGRDEPESIIPLTTGVRITPEEASKMMMGIDRDLEARASGVLNTPEKD